MVRVTGAAVSARHVAALQHHHAVVVATTMSATEATVVTGLIGIGTTTVVIAARGIALAALKTVTGT